MASNVPAVAEARQLSPEQRVITTRQFLAKAQNEILKALPFHLRANDDRAERFQRIILSLVNGKGMEKIPPREFARAAIRAAEIGLEPDPVYGQLFLIPYGERLQPIIGYKGILELAWRSDRITGIWAEVVYKEDKFTYRRGLDPVLEHEPNLDVDQTGKTPIAVYAVATFKGTTQDRIFVVLPKWDVYRRRDRSSGYQMALKYKKETPWHSDEIAMWRKTAVRALQPWLPQSVQQHIAKALAVEDEEEAALSSVTIDTEFLNDEPHDEPKPEDPKPEPKTESKPEPTQSDTPAETNDSTGPFKLDDFAKPELQELQDLLWKGAGMNRARLVDHLAKWQGTKSELLQHAKDLAAKMNGGQQ